MQTIDFINKTGFEMVTFPDGELHLIIPELNRKESVTIKTRIASSDELFLLMQLSDILNRQCAVVEEIQIYYLMGMRCDRLFDISRPFTLKIVADVINSFNAHKVSVIEPHSDRTIDLINRSCAINLSERIAKQFIKDGKDFLFAAPDQGALKRYDLSWLVCCKKVRDAATGNLTGFEVMETCDLRGQNILMVDDLCDGGGTFLGIAPKIREFGCKSLSLLVTHAIQLSGIVKVAKAYNEVYITDSFDAWDAVGLPDNVHVFHVDELINNK